MGKLCYYFTHLIIIINSLNPVHTTTLILSIIIIIVVIMTMITMIVHVCSNSMVMSNCFTREGVEQIEKAVRERNSAGDMTELKLIPHYLLI